MKEISGLIVMFSTLIGAWDIQVQGVSELTQRYTEDL